MPLKIVRAFVKNQDGTYVPFWENQKDVDDSKGNQQILKPAQYRTYIRVGK